MQVAVNIAVLAAIYALICCGYVLIYRVSRVLSLAHGELMMLGAYGLYATASLFKGHPLVALVAAAALAVMVGVAVYLALMWRMTGESVLAAVLADPRVGAQRREELSALAGSAGGRQAEPGGQRHDAWWHAGPASHRGMQRASREDCVFGPRQHPGQGLQLARRQPAARGELEHRTRGRWPEAGVARQFQAFNRHCHRF